LTFSYVKILFLYTITRIIVKIALDRSDQFFFLLLYSYLQCLKKKTLKYPSCLKFIGFFLINRRKIYWKIFYFKCKKTGNIVFLATAELNSPWRNIRWECWDICSKYFFRHPFPRKPPIKTICHLIHTIYTFFFHF